MARPKSTDVLQNFRFALSEPYIDPNAGLIFNNAEVINTLLGFQGITIPETSIESMEIIEGTEMFPHHVNVGRATTGSVTLTKAVLPGKSVDLYYWIRRAIFGIGVSRRNFLVHHFVNDVNAKVRHYLLEGCIPESWKPTTDLSGEDDAVSIEEITLHCHQLILKVPQIDEAVTLNAPALFDF